VKKLSGFMTRQSVIKIADGIVRHMSDIGYDYAEIHFVGGEPTMLGPEFFEDVIPEVRKILDGHGFKYHLCLISNLMHKDILRIAKLFDRINTSWEPVSRFPKPKLEQMWRDSVATLRQAGISPAITTSITKPLIEMGAAEVLERLYRIEEFRNIYFGFFIPSGDGLSNQADIFPEFHETSSFLIDVADWFFERRAIDPTLNINPINSMLAAIHTNTPIDDIVCPIIAGSMDIDWNGNAATCIEAGGNIGAKWAGNVLTTSIPDVAKSQAFRRDVIKAAKPHPSCVDCDAYEFCRSGCGVLATHWDPENDQDCPGFKGFIDHMRERHAKGARPNFTDYGSRVAGC